jgi:hypothetical protein
MSSSAGGSSPALHTDGRESSDDRPTCLENPRPAGAESTLTENVTSPFQAEPAQICLYNSRHRLFLLNDLFSIFTIAQGTVIG